ncbi:aryl-alcohol-oxidase from pleurotus Eryingii [Mycena metata]|uniref:Aryl-alcohol-oxidase from pleurotus Eryingii n=1 Tax=Mycena metata TaxID=1033252 RepID=A0AAD7NS07_9AGAR|nr:aryl-alcohol-oxidase from pleurotus Eryingii [Mycena metata]
MSCLGQAILGGGTAGNVVANRLSEDPKTSVLVLEAGTSNADVLDIIVPFLCTRATPDTAQDWNYTTTPQSALNNRSIVYPRGFVLGGSSSVNYMVYTRGSKDDFNRWAKVTGDKGWGWDSLLPYFKKNEVFTPPADHHDTKGQFNPAVHGFHGINSVSLAGFPSPRDHQGTGWAQGTIKEGARSSSATSYLAPNFVARPNLHVLLHARVTRVLQTASKTFRTVEFRDLSGDRFTVTAQKEAILSAGSIGTPTILLHSGIGNSSTLKSLGITPVHNLPSVGQNLTDHSLAFLSFLVNSNNTFETFDRNATLLAADLAEWNKTRMGPLVDNPLSHTGWLRIPDDSSIFKQFPDAAAGPNTPHYEFIISNGMFLPPPPTGNFMGVITAVVSPTSRGSITLATSDLLAPPLINPNLLGSEVDFLIIREAVKSAFRFASSPSWKNYVISPFGLSFNSTDSEIDEWIRENGGSVFHPAGSCSMSPKGAAWGVVDPDLSVKGLSGLRVVDLSIVPFIPAAHTQASAYVIGERASDLIKEYWSQ